MLRNTNELFVIRLYFTFYDIKSKTIFVKQEVGRQLGCVENDGMLSFACLHRLTQWISRLVTDFPSYFFLYV